MSDDDDIDADVPLTAPTCPSSPDVNDTLPPDLATFLGSFFKAKGAAQALLIALLLSFSFSSTVGVVSRGNRKRMKENFPHIDFCHAFAFHLTRSQMSSRIVTLDCITTILKSEVVGLLTKV
jgi:hypothetical protein